MELNKIKLLDKTELLQKLKQNGFTEVVNILEDKEINGEKFIELKEFEIFKWKLSQPQKRCLWNCIKDIKAKPYILFNLEKRKLPYKECLERSTSFSQNESTNLFKGKLESLLGTSATSAGSASTLPNNHSRTVNNVNKNAVNHVTTIKPLPPLPNDSKENQSSPVQKKIQNVIRQPPMTLPEKINSKNGSLSNTRLLKTDSFQISNIPDSIDMYIDMQPPANITKGDDAHDGDYLTPSDMPVPAPNFKNSSGFSVKTNNFDKKGIGKNRVPLPPPLPNKNTNVPTKEQKPWSSPQRKLPNADDQEEEDTYETPPKIILNGIVHRSPNFPNNSKENHKNENVSNLSRKIQAFPNTVTNINKFAIEIVTNETEEESNYEVAPNEEKHSFKKTKTFQKTYKQFPTDEESDDTYENPPPLKPKTVPNNRTRRAEINKPNIPTIQAEPTKKKATVKDVENILIINEKETQGPVLTKLTSTLSSFFRGKRPKGAYENHSIILNETRRESVTMSVRNRPLPETPINEITEQRKEPEARDNLFSRPFPPPRQIPAPVSDSQNGYVELIRKLNAPKGFPPPFRPKNEVDEFEGEQTYLNVAEKTQEGNISLAFNRNRQKNTSIKKDNASKTSYEISNKLPQISVQDKLASILAEQLRQRNLLKKQDSSDIEDEDEQPVYDNTPTPTSNIPTSKEKKLPPYPPVAKNLLHSHNIIKVEKEFDTNNDDDDQPVYDNTPTPTKNESVHAKNSLSPNRIAFKSNSPTRNILRVNSGSDSDDDQDQPVYGNSPAPIRKAFNKEKNNVSPDPFAFKNNSLTRNISRVESDDENEDDHDQPVYGNNPVPTRNISIQAKNTLLSNSFVFKKNSPTNNVSKIHRESHSDRQDLPPTSIETSDDNDDFGDDSSSCGSILEIINPLIPNISNRGNNNLLSNPRSFVSKIVPSTSIKPIIKDEYSEDIDGSSYDVAQEITPIYKRPLPEVPKHAPVPNTRPSIRNRVIITPTSSSEENIDDENITYGNIDESTPTFMRLPPRTDTKFLNNKSINKALDSLPKPPIQLNYEHYTANVEQEPVTISEDEEDEDYVDSIFNINDEPYYRNTDRKGAKLLLRKLEDGAFLFRPSQSHFLVLTIKYNGKFYNLGIERSSNNKIRLNAEGDSMAPEFATLSNFVNYFKKEPVTFQDKGVLLQIYLKTVLPPTLF